MELRDLEYFIVVAEHRKLGAAAATLRISQPALSKAIARLETALEVKLFARSQSGMTPTAEGELLLSRARDLRLSLRNVASEVTDLSRGRSGNIRIGVGPTIDADFVMAETNRLIAGAPRLAVQVVISDADEIEPMLRRGQLDLIINFMLAEQSVAYRYATLYADEFVVCCSSRHRLARRELVQLQDLVRERWTVSQLIVGSQRYLFDLFRAHDLVMPPVAFECRGLLWRLAATAASDLLLFTSRRIVERAIASGADLRVLPIEGLSWRPAVAAMYRKEPYVHPAVLELVKALEAAAHLEASSGKHAPAAALRPAMPTPRSLPGPS